MKKFIFNSPPTNTGQVSPYFKDKTAFEDFIDGIGEDTEISVHAEAYLYGEGETFKATIEEVAYFHLRMQQDENFLAGHCDNIESVDFTCNYYPDELFGLDWG